MVTGRPCHSRFNGRSRCSHLLVGEQDEAAGTGAGYGCSLVERCLPHVTHISAPLLSMTLVYTQHCHSNGSACWERSQGPC